MRVRGGERCVTQWGGVAEPRALHQNDGCNINRRNLLKAAAFAAGAATMSVGEGRAAVRPKDALALTATEAVAAIRRGDITAEAYAKTLLARAEAFKRLNAYIVLNRSGLLAAARAVDVERSKGGTLGRLAGLPLLVKDNINTKGLPTTAGTKGLADNRPKHAAPALVPLLAAGAAVMAKMNMHELAFGITSSNSAFGFVENPYDTATIPGGSSGGTAAGIAARMAPAGLGTDTGGSVRIPPALCGVVGFRPSVDNGHKRYPSKGVVPISHTRDTVGPMGRTVADVALLDSVITGEQEYAPAKLAGLRLGVPRGYFWEDLDSELSAVTDAALVKLRDRGVVLVEADLAGIGELNGKISFPVALYEVGPDLRAYLKGEGDAISFDQVEAQIASKDVAGAFGGAKTMPKEAYEAAINTYRPQLQKLYADYFAEQKVAAILFPTTPLPARPINKEGDTGKDTVELNGKQVPTFLTYIRNTDPGSNAGIPGLSLPVGLTNSGLPVGLELDGPVNSDRRLLAIGLSLERVFGRLPPPKL
jgi:indoleacetamide hydrolase